MLSDAELSIFDNMEFLKNYGNIEEEGVDSDDDSDDNEGNNDEDGGEGGDEEAEEEVLKVSYTTKWIIGWTYDLFAPSEYPGADDCSFGFRCDGMILYKGEAYQYTTKSLQDVTVLGLLADLGTGTLSLYADGKNLGPAFGVDSVCFDKKEQRRQGKLIRSKHLIPAFAIEGLGLHVSRVDELAEALSSLEQGRGGAEEGGSSGAGGADHGGNSVGSNGSNIGNASPSNAQHSPKMQRKSLSARRLSGLARSSSTESLSSPKAVQSAELPAEKVTLTVIARNAANYCKLEDCPSLSVNFGGFGFSHRPPDASSCDAYLSFARDNDIEAGLGDGIGGLGMMTPVNEGVESKVPLTPVTADASSMEGFGHNSLSRERSNSLKEVFENIRFQRSLDYRFTSKEDDTMLNYRRLQVSGKEMAALKFSGNEAWLPPEGVRVAYADGFNKLQRSDSFGRGTARRSDPRALAATSSSAASFAQAQGGETKSDNVPAAAAQDSQADNAMYIPVATCTSSSSSVAVGLD